MNEHRTSNIERPTSNSRRSAPFHEPLEPPPGFGVRQSSGALAMGASRAKAPEDWRSPRRYRAIRRFMVPMHAKKRKGALHEPLVAPAPLQIIGLSVSGWSPARSGDALNRVCNPGEQRHACGAVFVACRSSTGLFSTGGPVRGADDTPDRGGIE